MLGTTSYFSDGNVKNKGEFFYMYCNRSLFTNLSQHFFKFNDKYYIEDNSFKHITDMIVNKFNDKIFNIPEKTNQLHLENVLIITTGKYLNAGHVYGTIMNTIFNFFNSGENIHDYSIVVTDEIRFSKFLTTLIYFFFDKDKIFLLDDNTTLIFEKCFYCVNYDRRVPQYDRFLIDLLLEKRANDPKLIDNENICMIKTNQSYSHYNSRHFDETYNEYIKSKGFTIIRPEDYDLLELFNILYNAKNVILSWGCCSYLNSAFLNENVNFLCLGHISYAGEYNITVDHVPNHLWQPIKYNKILYSLNLPTYLDENTIQELNNKIDELLETRI
jgi:hypothetical protein